MDFGNKKLNLALLTTFFVYATLPAVYAEKRAEEDEATWSERMAKNAVLEFDLWDGNQISTYHRNNGAVVDHNATGNSGLEWPKGSEKTAVFASGIWMAGMVQGGIRTAAAEYTREFQPGAHGENPNDSKYRIYRMYKAEVDGMMAGNSTAEFDLNNDGEAEIITIPTKDYREWPVDDGAPFIDVDGDKLYDYNVDFPDILGDQFHWYIMNDGWSHANLWATLPLNVEVQTSIFGFDRAPNDALGNTMFVRWVIVNKGDDTIDSMFVSIWHDDDVGDANDDFVGCDTTLSIGYTFNDGRDATYGVAVPVSGSDFFQGPLVDAPGDSAELLTWNVDLTGIDSLGNPISGYFQEKVYDKRMLPLTSFVKYIRGDDEYGDPETAEEAYRYMNGLKGIDGQPYLDPNTGEPGVFIANGDPVTGTGWLDSDRHASGDRRFLMTSGPFTMAPGDKQEVVGSLMVAGGPDALTSIRVFKYFDKFAQNAFDSNFDLCGPPAPKVTVSQLDEKIILSWEDNAEDVVGYTCLGYEFQGYNVYQGESAVGPWRLLKTFDLVDDVRIITDETLDLETGLLLSKPVQFGEDSGVKHFIEITKDAVRNSQLINNRQYYFSVTAYAYDPATAPVTVESAFKSITAVPGRPGLGHELEYTHGELLSVEHVSGSSDAIVQPLVIDPYVLSGDAYEITFFEAGSHEIEEISTENGDTVSVLDTYQGDNQYLVEIETGGESINMMSIELNFEWYHDSTFSVDTSYIYVTGDTFIQVIENDTLIDTVSSSGSFIVEYTDSYGNTFSSAEQGGTADLIVTNFNPGNNDFTGSFTGTLTNPVDYNYVLADASIEGSTVNGSFTVTNLSYEGEPLTQYWRLRDNNTNDVIYMNNTDVVSGAATTIIDGFQITVVNGVWDAEYYESELLPESDEDILTTVVFGGISSDSPNGAWSGFIQGLIDFGIPLNDPSGTPDKTILQEDLELRFTAEGSVASFYGAATLASDAVDTMTVPFELWSLASGKQINTFVYKVGGLGDQLYSEVDSGSGSYQLNWNVSFMPVYEDYDPDKRYNYATDADIIGWMMNLNKDNTVWENGNIFQVKFLNPIIPGTDVYNFVASGLNSSDADLLASQMDAINVYPNPYFGSNWEENNPLDRRVYFTQLGVGITTIRIFTLAGALVSKIEKTIISENDRDRRAVWDLRNRAGVPVASGMYLAHLELKDSNGKSIGEKVLKLAIFQPEERLDIY